MHEMSLMQQVIDEINRQLDEQEADKTKVREVRLKVGALDIHSEAAFRQAFELLVTSTPLERARLDLTVEPARLVCAACGHEAALAEGEIDPHDPSPYVVCPKCGAVCTIQGGRGVLAIELLVENE